MVAEEFEIALKSQRARKPFRPFTIEQASGERVRVDLPEAIAVRDGVAAFVGPGGVPFLFDHETVSLVIGE